MRHVILVGDLPDPDPVALQAAPSRAAQGPGGGAGDLEIAVVWRDAGGAAVDGGTLTVRPAREIEDAFYWVAPALEMVGGEAAVLLVPRRQPVWVVVTAATPPGAAVSLDLLIGGVA